MRVKVNFEFSASFEKTFYMKCYQTFYLFCMSFSVGLGGRHSFVKSFCSFTCNKQNHLNIDYGERCNKIGGASCNAYVFFHFVSQEELIASKVILLPFTKLILGVRYLYAIV